MLRRAPIYDDYELDTNIDYELNTNYSTRPQYPQTQSRAFVITHPEEYYEDNYNIPNDDEFTEQDYERLILENMIKLLASHNNRLNRLEHEVDQLKKSVKELPNNSNNKKRKGLFK